MVGKHTVLLLSLWAAIGGCGGKVDSGSRANAGALPTVDGAGGKGSLPPPVNASSSNGGGASMTIPGSGGEGVVFASGGGASMTTPGSGGEGVVFASGGGAGVQGWVNACNANGDGIAGGVASNFGGWCNLPSVEVANRSDSEQSWDDNDFSSVVVCGDSCRKTVDVTWPHEANWQNADPAESNGEATHFTLDSANSTDLTGRWIHATVLLERDARGSATDNHYDVSLTSTSTYDAGESEGIARTGYAEVELPVEQRRTLRYQGDLASVDFKLPDKTSAVDSYDPKRATKISLRIYSGFGEHATAGGTGGAGAADPSAASGVGGYGAAPTYDYTNTRFAIWTFMTHSSWAGASSTP